MTWGDLSWLSDCGYERLHEADEHRPEAWVRRSMPTRGQSTFWRELIIQFTGCEHSKEYCRLSAAMLDDNGCMVSAAIDEIEFSSLRGQLASFEKRVLGMLHVGLILDGD
jgi:hypothetical protein